LTIGYCGALFLNVHIHVLGLDGVYVEDKGGALCFHEIGLPTDDEMDRLLETIEGRIRRLLARRGMPGDVDEGGATDPWQDEAPVLAGLAAASVQSRRALGPRAGAPVRRMGASAALLTLARPDRGPCHARWNGFDLHAGVAVPPRDRARLERLCRLCGCPHKRHYAEQIVMQIAGSRLCGDCRECRELTRLGRWIRSA
jgi:hypothetical protein